MSEVEKFVKFYDSSFGKEVLDREVSYLRKELSGKERVLDLGCGIGSFEEKLTDFNITGLDNSNEMLKEAKKRSNGKFVLGSAESLDFAGQSFDAVFTVTTLEFLHDYKRAVIEVARVLKPNGKFVAMMLNPESEYFKTRAQKESSYFKKIEYRYPKEIEEYISKLFAVSGEYFLGIHGTKILDTNDKNLAALYVVKGVKK